MLDLELNYLLYWTVLKSLCITIHYKLLTDKEDVTSELYISMLFELNILCHGPGLERLL